MSAGQQGAPRGGLLTVARALFAIKLLGLALLFAAQVLLARWLGPKEFGVYTYAMSWAMLLSVLAAAGIPTAIVRFTSEYRARQQSKLLAGLMLWGPLVAASVGGVLTVTGLVVLNRILNVGSAYTAALRIALCAIPLLAVMKVMTGLIRAFDRTVLAYVPDVLGRPLVMMAAAGGLVAVTGHAEAAGALLLTMACLLLFAIFQLVIFYKGLPSQVTDSSREYRHAAWLRVCLPLVLVAGFEVITERVDVLMIGAYLTPEDVATYNAAAKLAGLLVVVLAVANATVAPRIARLYSLGDMAGLQRTISRLLPWTFWPSLCAGVVLVLGGRHALSLFGPAFVSGHQAMALLVIAQLVNSGAGPVLMLLNMTGRQDRSALIFAVSAALNITLNSFFIPRFGIVGAASATAISMLIWNVWMAIVVRRELNIVSFIFGQRLSRADA